MACPCFSAKRDQSIDGHQLWKSGLITSENPELREVDLEPSSKRGCSQKKKVQNNI